MTQYKRIGIDTSKAVFTLHGIDQKDRPVLRLMSPLILLRRSIKKEDRANGPKFTKTLEPDRLTIEVG